MDKKRYKPLLLKAMSGELEDGFIARRKLAFYFPLIDGSVMKCGSEWNPSWPDCAVVVSYSRRCRMVTLEPVSRGRSSDQLGTDSYVVYTS